MNTLEDTIDAERPKPRQPSPHRSRSPRIVRLTRTECTRLLARNHVGRLAYTFRDLVDIVPLHYAYADGWIYGRTSPGQKVAKLQHHRWVAFEVDEVHGLFDWQSVVVHGGLYVLQPDSATSEVWQTAVLKLREFLPGAFTDHDPLPVRTIVFRIHVDSVSGRRATPSTR
jgi:uncharacterized protein